ncbi:MAG: DUF423 domain-containing protein [Chitinophagaceae bacterium]
MRNYLLACGAFTAAVAVALGAFGSHFLKTRLPESALLTFETGVRYQFYHAFALLVAGLYSDRWASRWLKLSGLCFISGILFFSGSLYVITLLKLFQWERIGAWGLITPAGGLLLLLGWIFLLRAFLSKQAS